MELQMNRMHDAFAWIEREFENTGEIQSVDLLIKKMDLLCAALPFVNSQMALAKKLWNEQKVQAYHLLITGSVTTQKYYAPSLAKDYVNARCSEHEYNYDLCERLSRSMVHVMDALRTCISALKQESIVSQYSNH